MKKRIRLTESDLRRIVKESVKRVMVNEIGDTWKGASALGAVAGRAYARGNDKLGDRAYDEYENADVKPENDYPGSMFSGNMEDYYNFEKMTQDKEFLWKLVPIYDAYINDYGYDEMLALFEDEFEH